MLSVGVKNSVAASITPLSGERLEMTSAQAQKQLVARFDSNGNGKIDAKEHKAYAREVARSRDAEAKRLAAMRPSLSSDERLFVTPPDWTPEKSREYDVNQDGTLDPEERMKERQAAAAGAKTEFKKWDKNGDGKLDVAERDAAKQALARARAARDAEVRAKIARRSAPKPKFSPEDAPKVPKNAEGGRK
jgi:hypothetical protein